MSLLSSNTGIESAFVQFKWEHDASCYSRSPLSMTSPPSVLFHWESGYITICRVILMFIAKEALCFPCLVRFLLVMHCHIVSIRQTCAAGSYCITACLPLNKCLWQKSSTGKIISLLFFSPGGLSMISCSILRVWLAVLI